MWHQTFILVVYVFSVWEPSDLCRNELH